jgi:CubicO group peptidase (beta-lactamase class C family)
MQRSSFPVRPAGAGLATPYGRLIRGGAGRKPAGGSSRNWSGPAGALVTTAPELARFGRMVLRGGEFDGNRLLAKTTLEEATRIHALNHPDLDEGLGLGFFVATWRGRPLLSHDGGLAGVATRLALLPQEGVGVAVLTNGGDAAFTHRVTERVLEILTGLQPERTPGSPAGIPPERAAEWKAFTQRVTGSYRLVDSLPPGPLSVIFGAMVRPRLTHVAEGQLALDGVGSEPAFLYPDGAVGRFRLAFPLANGQQAVIEERANGTHLWASIVHLRKPR